MICIHHYIRKSVYESPLTSLGHLRHLVNQYGAVQKIARTLSKGIIFAMDRAGTPIAQGAETRQTAG